MSALYIFLYDYLDMNTMVLFLSVTCLSNIWTNCCCHLFESIYQWPQLMLTYLLSSYCRPNHQTILHHLLVEQWGFLGKRIDRLVMPHYR